MILFAALLLMFQDASAEGIKAMEAGKYPEAIKLLSEALAKNPQDYYVQFNVALAHSGAGQNDLAIAGYRKTLELKPKLYEADLNLGILLVQMRRAKEALPLLEEAQFMKPSDYRPAYFLAEAQVAVGAFDKAEGLYRVAMAANPVSAEAEFGMAGALAGQGRLDDAEPHYRKAAGLDGQYRDAVLDLAAMYEKKEPARAMEIYRQFPQSAAAQERLGTLLIEQKSPEEAIGPLEFAVSKAPTAANRNNLIQAYLRTKRPEKALPVVAAMLAESPRDVELYMLRGRIYRDAKNFKEAANSFFGATKVKADSVEAWNELSAMLISLEDYPGALGAFDRLRELKAETPPHWFFRAIIFDKLKQAKPALEAYRKFLELAGGKYPDQEFQARQRARIIERELSKR